MDYPYVNIHTHRRTGEGVEVVSAMAGSGELPGRPCSLGIHPWQTGTPAPDFSDWLEEALSQVATASVDAVGEIGLDYARPASRSLQTRVFEAQLAIARERRLPVIIHCVRAFEPVMDILARYRVRAAIFHGFVGSPQQARRAVEAGYFLSFGERSLGSPRTVEAMRAVPASEMFFETDESRLPIAEIYRLAALAISGGDAGTYKTAIYENYKKIFEK